jgi:YtkA-like
MKGYFSEGRRVATSPFWRLFIAFACFIVLAGAACRRSTDSAQGISIRQEITPQPVRVGEATVAIQLADATANPVTHAAIMVEADMAHPGMAPVFKEANEIAPGSYQTKIIFTMGGDWVLLLHIKLANGSKIERQMDVRGVRSN